MELRFAMTPFGVVLPHIMPPALVVVLMYGLHERQLLHATTTALVGCTGILAVVAPDINRLHPYFCSLLEYMASAALVGFTIDSLVE